MKLFLVGDWASGDRTVSLGASDDFWLGNLEGPVLNGADLRGPRPKAGPHLASRSLPMNGGRWMLAAANNHLMDFGDDGWQATRRAAHSAGIILAGCGDDIVSARQTVNVTLDKIRIAVIACCEAQFGVATASERGVAVFGPWVYEAIREEKKNAHHVIVSCHAGLEDYPLPALWQRDLYRSWIDAGASIVHGHHSHVPQAYEAYGSGLIAYGLGNFLVDPNRWRGTANALWSLAFEVRFAPQKLEWRAFTYEIRDAGGSATLSVVESAAAEIPHRRRYLDRCNELLRDDATFDTAQQEIALRAFDAYGAAYIGFGDGTSRPITTQLRESPFTLVRWLRATLRTPKDDRGATRIRYLMLMCESHRQMLATALSVRSGEVADCRTPDISRRIEELLSE